MEATCLQIGYLLATSHEIIKKIFTNLGYYDLITALDVCESWNAVGKAILLKERKLKYTTIHPNNVPTTDEWVILKHAPNANEVLEDFLENLTSKSVYFIGFTCGGWLFRKDIVTKYFPNGNTLTKTIQKALHKDIELALIESSGIVGSVEKKFASRDVFLNKYLSASISNALSEEGESGRKGECSGESANDDTGTRRINSGRLFENEDKGPVNLLNNVGYSIELEESFNSGDNLEAVSFIVLPKQPGVNINIFNLNEKEFYKNYRPNVAERQKSIKITKDEFDSICGLTAKDRLQAFLVLTHSLRNFTKSFLEAAQNRENDNLAIGGGLIDWMQQKEETYEGTLGIAISGENVQTASIVVSADVRDELEFYNCLKKLKEEDLPEDHSVCFMFSCCGRGSYWYSRNTQLHSSPNIETTIFRKLFPKTPVFGFFGNGEIGNNYHGLYEEKSSSKKKKKRQNLVHQYSTVFVLISFL